MLTVNVDVASVEDEPVIAPVELLRLKPVGSAPDAIEYVNGEIPPVSPTLPTYGRLLVPVAGGHVNTGGLRV